MTQRSSLPTYEESLNLPKYEEIYNTNVVRNPTNSSDRLLDLTERSGQNIQNLNVNTDTLNKSSKIGDSEYLYIF